MSIYSAAVKLQEQYKGRSRVPSDLCCSCAVAVIPTGGRGSGEEVPTKTNAPCAVPLCGDEEDEDEG